MKMLLKSQKGSTIIIFGLITIILIGFASLVTDIGRVAVYKSMLAKAVDSAALAGAQELIYNEYPVEWRVNQYIHENGYPNHSVDIDINDTSVRVSAAHQVEYKLAKFLGYSSQQVYVSSKAVVLPIIGINEGIRPFAIENYDFEYGEQYVLKKGGGDGSSGNYGGVGLGGNGAHVYYNNIIEGYNERLMTGDYIQTEPGNMSGPTENGVNYLINQCNHHPTCTYENFNLDCPRIITVIIVDNMDVNGRSTVQIQGFASFFLEGVAGSGNECEVTGRFIRTITNGIMEEGQQDFGLYGVKLTD